MQKSVGDVCVLKKRRTLTGVDFSVTTACDTVDGTVDGTVDEADLGVLRRRHPHIRDASMYFREDGHKYFVDWYLDGRFDDRDIVSVSAMCKDYFDAFDADDIIRKMMKSKKWSSSKYYGMTPGEIKRKWRELGNKASSLGTEHHLVCEKFYNGLMPDRPCNKAVSQFLEFARHHSSLVPFRTEWALRSNEEHRVCGTIDMLFFSENHDKESGVLRLTMFDWKNSKEIKTDNRWSSGRHPFLGLPNCNHAHYTIQLNVYKYLLETCYSPILVDGRVYDKIHVDSMFLVVMHENRDEYLKVELPDYQDRVATMFEMRAEKLSSSGGGVSVGGEDHMAVDT